MAWVYLLAAVLILRTKRHRSELESEDPSLWALSGSSASHERAASLEVQVSDDELRNIFSDFDDYLSEISATSRHPGMPPGLLYSQFGSRPEYVWSLVSRLPNLADLFELVQRMVRLPFFLIHFFG